MLILDSPPRGVPWKRLKTAKKSTKEARVLNMSLKMKHNRPCIKLLSGLDGRGLWLIIHLLDVSPHSVSGILRSGLSLLYQHRKTTPEDAAHRISHRPWPSSPDSNFMDNAGRESLRQFHNRPYQDKPQYLRVLQWNAGGLSQDKIYIQTTRY